MGNYNNFGQALAAGRVGEKLAAQYLTAIGYQIEDVSKNKEYFSQDIDFLADNGKTQMAVEVKADSRMQETKNVAVEPITNVEFGKDGWFITSKATHIFFVDVKSKVIHCVRLEELRQLFKQNKKQYRRIITHQKECGMYYKEGEIYLIPLADLETLPHYVKLDKSVVARYA